MVQLRPLAPHSQDDAFREIQLNGKQLVFLFMVATVVSVVIFLCGVFVGRGVRTERAVSLADASSSTPITTPDVRPDAAAAPPVVESDPAATPPPAVDELSYFSRLEQPGQPAEKLKAPGVKTAALEEAAPAEPARKPPVAEKGPFIPPFPAALPSKDAAPPAKDVAPAPTPAAKEPAAAVDGFPTASAAFPEPTANGYALQVTALRERGEAEAVAKRLSAKGYAAYVITPQENSAPKYYRVRIGKFQTRREAEDIASKLQKEEQIKPWITR